MTQHYLFLLDFILPFQTSLYSTKIILNFNFILQAVGYSSHSNVSFQKISILILAPSLGLSLHHYSLCLLHEIKAAWDGILTNISLILTRNFPLLTTLWLSYPNCLTTIFFYFRYLHNRNRTLLMGSFPCLPLLFSWEVLHFIFSSLLVPNSCSVTLQSQVMAWVCSSIPALA